MSEVIIDEVSYEAPPQVAGLLQAVSEERDELRGLLEEAWGVIGNANWGCASDKWRTDVRNWRERYCALLPTSFEAEARVVLTRCLNQASDSFDVARFNDAVD